MDELDLVERLLHLLPGGKEHVHNGGRTRQQNEALRYIRKINSVWSIIGSLYIIYSLLRHETRNSTYDNKRRVNTGNDWTSTRILLALSICDFLSSVWIFLADWTKPPRQTSYDDTPWECKAQAFFIQLGFAVPLYNASLAIYFYLVIVGRGPLSISRTISNWNVTSILLVGFPMIWGLVTATSGIILDLFHEYVPMGLCWIGGKPIRCAPEGNFGGAPECEREQEFDAYRLAFGYVPLVGCFLIMMISFAVIFFRVRNTERAAAKWTNKWSIVSSSSVKRSNQSASRLSSVVSHRPSFDTQPDHFLRPPAHGYPLALEERAGESSPVNGGVERLHEDPIAIENRAGESSFGVENALESGRASINTEQSRQLERTHSEEKPTPQEEFDDDDEGIEYDFDDEGIKSNVEFEGTELSELELSSAGNHAKTEDTNSRHSGTTDAAIKSSRQGVWQQSLRKKRHKKKVSKSQRVATQSMCYAATFFLTWTFPIISWITTRYFLKRYFVIDVLTAFFLPLQGFFNCLVFVRPRLSRDRSTTRT